MSATAPGPRAGHTLAEALVALLLSGALIACLAGVLAVVGRLAIRQERATGEADTERVVAAVLGSELRALTGADALFHDDSVRLRAFRGTGVVCTAEPRDLTVRYQGLRVPEPGKDSVLLVWATSERVRALDGVDSRASCPMSGGPALRLAVDWGATSPAAAPVPPALALVFETGAYSVSGAAFRYRRGAGGRQPLTETILDGRSGIEMLELEGTTATAAVVGLFYSEAAAPGAPVAWRLLMPQGGERPPASGP